MKKIMDQAEQLTVAFGDQRVDRIVAIEETSPGQVGDNFGQGGFAAAAVEGVVAVPQWLPSRKIFITKLANQNFFAHGFARVRVAVKFGSQVLPPSSEKDCSKWWESGVMSDQTTRTSMVLPL